MAKREEAARERRLGLYRGVCKGLLEQFQQIVDQFNSEYHFGKIQTHPGAGTTYRLPSGKSIEVHFFEPVETSVRVQGGQVIGGGWVGITEGTSANLVLLRTPPDDHYGRWVICEIGFMALADLAKLIGRFGITPRTVKSEVGD